MAKQQTLSTRAEPHGAMPIETGETSKPKPIPAPSAQSPKPARVAPVTPPVRTPSAAPKSAIQPPVPDPKPEIKPQPKPQVSQAEISGITTGTPVRHRSFRDGHVTKIEGNVTYVSFAIGEKNFQFPDVFYQGFLSVKK